MPSVSQPPGGVKRFPSLSSGPICLAPSSLTLPLVPFSVLACLGFSWFHAACWWHDAPLPPPLSFLRPSGPPPQSFYGPRTPLIHLWGAGSSPGLTCTHLPFCLASVLLPAHEQAGLPLDWPCCHHSLTHLAPDLPAKVQGLPLLDPPASVQANPILSTTLDPSATHWARA